MTDRADPLGCFCPGRFTPIEGAPDGPLRGLDFAVKDLIDTAGEISGAGNPDWRRTHEAATTHAAVVQRLLEAGARLVGRTLTDELAFSLEGENHFYGTPTNPRAPDRLPGGSSSGSAVAVASGLVDFALGTDTGGSVRVPASFCGVHGMRPTHGALPAHGVVPFAPSLDTVGWFARSASLLATVGNVLLPPAEFRDITCLLIADDALALADKEVRGVIEAAVARMPCRLKRVNAAPFPLSEVARSYQVIQAADIVSALGAWLRRANPTFGPNIAPRFHGIFDYTPEDLAAAHAVRDALRAYWTKMLGDEPDALVVVPSAPCVALARGLAGDAIGAFYQRALAIGGIASLAGLPQLSVPITASGHLPVGLGLVAAAGSDRALLRFAERLPAM